MQRPGTMWAFALHVTWSDIMRLLLFLLLISNLLLVTAQEDSPASEEEMMQEQKTEDESGDKKQLEVETPDTFDPTEKLSEDIPAPFPVDI